MGPAQKPLIVPVFVPHGGCPHRCVFCNQSLITGAPATAFHPMDIRRRITSFLDGCRLSSRPSQIAFYGGNFLGLPPEKIIALLAEAARFVAEKKAGGIRFSTRPDTVSPEQLALLSGFPVQTVEIGAQSMDDRVLEMAERGHTADDTCRAAVLTKKNGFRLGLQIMVGLPGDDEDISMDTARRVAALMPDFVRIYPTVVMAGSRLADWYKGGSYTPWPLDRAVSQTARMLLFFQSKKIPVIRMGLQATDGLQQGDTILAGPYHPAFGHLVFSRIFFDRAVTALAHKLEATGGNNHSQVVFQVHPRVESQLRGLRNGNLHRLKEIFGLTDITIRTNPLAPEGSVEIA